MKRSPIKRKSKRRQAEDRQRVVIRVELLEERGELCEWCRTTVWTDMHEVLPRGRMGSAVDKSNIRCLCRGCHQWVHGHPAEAARAGLLVLRER